MLKTIASLDDILLAITTEREYQRYRWGVRNTDGSFTLHPESPYAYLLYISRYIGIATFNLGVNADHVSILHNLRKAVALAVRGVEEHGCTIDVDIRRTPFEEFDMDGGLAYFVLLLKQIVDDGIEVLGLKGQKRQVGLVLHDIVRIGVLCFRLYGITPRDLSATIYNARDHQLVTGTRGVTPSGACDPKVDNPAPTPPKKMKRSQRSRPTSHRQRR